jgi:hypothetical protein
LLPQGLVRKVICKLINGIETKFSTPNKKRIRPSPKSSRPEGAEKTFRDIIDDFTIIEKRRPTLKSKLHFSKNIFLQTSVKYDIALLH